MSTRHIDQFDYTCDRCKAKRVVDVVDDTIVVLPNDWIELEGSPWDNRRHLCYKCAVDFADFMKNHAAYSGRGKLHIFNEALRAITHVATMDERSTKNNLAAFKTCQRIAANVLLENP